MTVQVVAWGRRAMKDRTLATHREFAVGGEVAMVHSTAMITASKPIAEMRAITATVELARFAGRMGWVPATSGNFSARVDGWQCAITASGGFKGETTEAAVMLVPIGDEGDPLPRGLSAEAPLHLQRYRQSPEIGAVAHVHSHASMVLSRRHLSAGLLRLEGWELLKAFRGIATHEASITIPIVENDQDLDRLAHQVARRLTEHRDACGYLIAGHGLYAWGRDAAETRRHLEAFDALFQLSIEEERLR